MVAIEILDKKIQDLQRNNLTGFFLNLKLLKFDRFF